MRLRTRLTAPVVVVSSAGTLLLGGIAISEVRASRFEAVDRTISAVMSQVQADRKDQVGAALLTADQSTSAVAIGFAAKGSEFTWLRELPDQSLTNPPAALRKQAKAGPVTSPYGYRLSAVTLREGETLVIAASIRAIDEQTRSDIILLTSFWALLSLLMGLLIRRIVRRDVEGIERLVVIATDIAGGVDDVLIPEERSTSSEVEALASALRQMVDSLRAVVVAEQSTTQRMQAFLGDASHELRTPLTVIRGYLELLQQDVEPQQRERALNRMRSESHRMELLVNDLLLLAEIGTPVPEATEAMDLSSMVRVLSEDLRELQPGRHVDINLIPGVIVRAVPSHLHRAVGNAFANIRRHTLPEHPVRVSLGARGTTAELVVEDGGPGLPDEMYAAGMSHFQRFDKSRARATGGSGLGMSIIRAVMDELGGNVEMSRSDLGGLRLRYTFPMLR